MKMMKGYVFGFFYIIFVAASTIWLNKIGNNFSIAVLLFYSSLISIVIFNLFTLKNIMANHRNIYNSIKNWVYMSISVLLIWYFSYYSSIQSSAGFFIPIFFLTTALLSSFSSLKRIKISACIISIILIYYFSPSSSPVVLFSSMAAGLSGFLYYHASFKFSEETGATVLAILSVRFYFLFVATVIYILSSGETSQLNLSIEEGIFLIFFGLVNMVIPVFLSQSSLQIIGVNKFTFLTTLIPTFTFFLEVICGNIWQSGMFLACLCATITLNMDDLEKLFRYRRKIRVKYLGQDIKKHESLTAHPPHQ